MKIQFKADPMYVIELMLRMYAERFIQGNPDSTDADIWAAYEYIDQLNDDKIYGIADKYSEIKGTKEINITATDEQKKEFFEIVYEDPIYKAILFKQQRAGNAGLGVADLKAGKFYRCRSLGEHWGKLWEVLREEYDEEIQQDKEMVEKFIMSNFEFVGESKALGDYMGEDLYWRWRPRGC
ncbi:hypothetical protein HB904_16855 [Listeria booriae]|uniref:Uncharacterized protein n=1 Tax=Listeria booriae TaxID=1552123 RepID=A0A841YQN5_9LIST|nr:hypothetical protein [Listeria booriae]MBC1402117.1 hypothetical protein [Listeria booriae]MBC1617849.1 hypothetical protein [Listeria booriae]